MICHERKNLDEIKEKIRTEIDKTEKSVNDYKEIIKSIAPENAIGRVSRIDAINNQSIAKSVLRRAEKRTKLKCILTQIDHEGFGICMKYRRPIPLGRILFRYCVNYAS